MLNKDYSNDYLYYGVPTPWLQIKLLRMLQVRRVRECVSRGHPSGTHAYSRGPQREHWRATGCLNAARGVC